MEREAFMARVTTAVHEAELPSALPHVAGPLVPEVAPDELVERFVSNLRAVDGACYLADSAEQATNLVVELMVRHQTTRYVSWDEQTLPVDGLLETLDHHGYVRVDADVSEGRAARESRHTEFAQLPVGITGADAGLAETGSLVLTAGAGRSRMASLVTPVHIALVSASTIVPSLSHWVDTHPTAARATANLVIVTGPSRTADIEQQLNLGVHGPGDLHVIVLSG
jgi:L-lactate dehydrogenase complex protein LldG